LLLANIQDLKETLISQGVKLDKLDVHINDGFNQSTSNFQEGLQKEKGSGAGQAGGEALAGDEESTDAFLDHRASHKQDSTIYLVA